MPHTQCGPRCDVCGEYILLEPVQSFTISISDTELLCHGSTCMELIKDIAIWTDLPAGPLRSVFERLAEKDDAWNHPPADEKVS